MASSPAEASASGSSAPNSIGRYRVIGRLGKGGMAEVLLALEHDPLRDFKRLVVVKRVIPALETEDPHFIQMFLDEARLGARLSHPNVVQTYEVGEQGGSPYLAIEFLEGQSLHVVQRRLHALGRKMPVNVGLRIFCDVLEALHYAHDLKDFDGKPLGVIHRDVTPSNIFVKYDGITKLVDFGIAKSATQREKTRAGMLKGKMAYMAPEQLRDEPINRSVDVWAMGIVVWETLAGERLFRGKNDFETVQAVMRREVPKLASKRDDIPKGLDEAILAAIERDPTKRYKTAEEFKNKLEEVAFSTGKPLRRQEVSDVMQDIMSEAIQQNQTMIKDFFEKAANPDTQGDSAFLRVNAKGALEIRKDPEGSMTGTASDSSGTRDTLTPSNTPSMTLPDAKRPAKPDGSVPRTSNSPSISRVSDKTVVDPNAANRAREMAEDAEGEGGEVEGEGEEDVARPWWHWAVLVAMLAVVGIVASMLLKR